MPKRPTPPPANDQPQPVNVVKIDATSDDQRRRLDDLETHRKAAALTRAAGRSTGMPQLSSRTIEAYLHWVVTRIVAEHISPPEAAILMRAAELVISNAHAGAQGKATTATLIDEGTIDPDQA